MQYGALSKQVAAAVLKAYSQLGPRGKPDRNGSGKREWNVLAGFALCTPAPTPEHAHNYAVECLSLGTGLKVIPNASYRPRGDGLHDSHAEVIARRSLLRWFYSQLELAVAGKVCHLERGEFEDTTEGAGGVGEGGLRRWRLKEGLLLGMYISTLPCGDASMYHLSLQPQIAPAATQISPFTRSTAATTLATPTEVNSSSSTDVMAANARLANDVGLATTYERDGPSAVSTQVQRGRQAYTISSLRTKPGRPDSPLATSHSCSDKISMWTYVGVQGGLLSRLLERVAIDVMVIGLVVKDDERERMTAEVRRGLGGRLGGVDEALSARESVVRQEYYLRLPEIHFSDVEFFHAKEVVLRRCGAVGNESDIVSGLSSLSFVAAEGIEMIIMGAKQGAAFKKFAERIFPAMHISRLSKFALMQRYRSIVEMSSPGSISNQSYFNLKHPTSPPVVERTTEPSTTRRRSYQEAKAVIRGESGPFSGWLVSGKELGNFDVEGDLL